MSEPLTLAFMRQFIELLPKVSDKEMAAALKWMIDYRASWIVKRDPLPSAPVIPKEPPE